MNFLNDSDLDAFEIGSTILGSGGGGDPGVEKILTHMALRKHGPAKIIEVSQLQANDLVIPIAFMGAPSVGTEMLPSGIEFSRIFQSISKYYGKEPSVIMPAEIGGSNAFVPFFVAAQSGLPVLNADGIGRAFPQLQMSTFNLFQVNPSPAFLADVKGGVVSIDLVDSCGSAEDVEQLARGITVSFGSSAAIAIYIMSGSQARAAVVPLTISRALALGRVILDSRRDKVNPVRALVEHCNGNLLFEGNIVDIDQKVTDGFLKGRIIVTDKDQRISVEYQNENLIVFKNDKPIASTPDIITLLDSENGSPVPVEQYRFGARVAVVALPGPDIWKSEKGLSLVGPKAFGYSFDYLPFQKGGF